MENIIYRFGQLADVDQIVRLRVLMQCEVHGQTFDDVDPNYSKLVHEELQKRLITDSFVVGVVEYGNKIISMNVLVIYKKLPSLSGGKGHVGYVSSVYTLPEWRQKGIASQLMKTLVTKAKELGLDSLNLGTTELGKGVYEGVGFKPVDFTALQLKLS